MISRYVSPEKKFSNWYFGTHQAYKSNHSEMVIRQLGDIADHDRMMTVFQKALLSLQALTPKTASRGIIYVDYGYSYAAVKGKNGLTLVSRQSAFNEVEYWKYDVSEQLGYSEENSDEDSPLDPLDLFVQWIDDPRDKLELFQDVFRKILKHIVNETLDRLGESCEKALLIMLPSLPAATSADWEKLLSSLTREKCTIIIDNHGAGMELQQEETQFLFHNYVSDGLETTLVEVFTPEPDGRTHADAYFYDKGYETDPRKLLMVEKYITHGGMKKSIPVSSRASEKNEIRSSRLPIRLGTVPGFTAFLRSHPATFRDSMFIPNDSDDVDSPRIRQITELFGPYESLSVAYICAQLCNENDLSGISLMDMASVCELLENKQAFQRTNLFTHKKKTLFGVVDELPLDIEAIQYIPSNYSSVGWKCLADPERIPDYQTLDPDSIEIDNIVPALQSIVAHYAFCSTEDVAADLYYFLKHGQEEPSALLTAKVYLILSKDPSFKAQKTSETVQKPVVDTQTYNSSIDGLPKKNFTAVRNTASFLHPASQTHTVFQNDITIAQMGLSMKTYNCLNRAGLTLASSVCAKSDAELLRIRNLGRSCLKEIREWQTAHEGKTAYTYGSSSVNPFPARTGAPVAASQTSVSKSNQSSSPTPVRSPQKANSAVSIKSHPAPASGSNKTGSGIRAPSSPKPNSAVSTANRPASASVSNQTRSSAQEHSPKRNMAATPTASTQVKLSSEPASLKHLPKKVHSKQYGVGVIIEFITSSSGTRIKVRFNYGIEKTFNEALALKSGTIRYQY